jgi:hypothetical protein
MSHDQRKLVLAIARPKIGLAILETMTSPSLLARKSLAEIADQLRDSIDAESHPVILRQYFIVVAARARLNGDMEGWREIVERFEFDSTMHGHETMSIVMEAHMRLGNESKAGEIASFLLNTEFRHPDFMKLFDEFPDLKAAAERRVH